MLLDFPSSPTIGQKYPASPVVGVPTYTWDGEKWTTIGGSITSASPATALPLMDAAAVVGVATKYAREDHVHPSDTSRVAKAGDTMTGALIVASTIMSQAAAASGTYYFGSNSNYITYQSGSFSVNGGPVNITGALVVSSEISSSFGYQCRNGTSGAMGANAFNFFYSAGAEQAWVDGAFLGNISFTSDYRIKKDVQPLPGMWDTVKALRPIKYTQAEFTPPSQVEFLAAQKLEGREVSDGSMFPADDIERWGFIAHELQETLTPSAATGEKDSHDTVQSPNPFTLIAALTKALQEAMARIEALEVAAR